MIQKQIQERQKKKNKTQESLKEDQLFFPPVCKWETPVWLTYSIHEASKLPF